LIDVIKGTVSSDVLGWKSFVAMPCQNHNDIESIFYLRLLATDKPGVLADITAIFANHNISVEAVVQKQIDEQDNAHIAIITNQVKTGDIQAAVAEIQNHDFIQEKIKIIHVETLDAAYCAFNNINQIGNYRTCRCLIARTSPIIKR
jgi:homoserine dehydrogenase